MSAYITKHFQNRISKHFEGSDVNFMRFQQEQRFFGSQNECRQPILGHQKSSVKPGPRGFEAGAARATLGQALETFHVLPGGGATTELLPFCWSKSDEIQDIRKIVLCGGGSLGKAAGAAKTQKCSDFLVGNFDLLNLIFNSRSWTFQIFRIFV